MTAWTLYPAFVGTCISVIGWTYLAVKEHVSHIPRTLSELAAEKPQTLRYYRIILWVCGPLFAITTLFFIVPRIDHQLLVAIACGLTILTELLVGMFPARGSTVTLHNIISALMGFGMTISAYIFGVSLHGAYRPIELLFGILLTILAGLIIDDRKRYLFYELPFIYLAHVSILVAAIALSQ